MPGRTNFGPWPRYYVEKQLNSSVMVINLTLRIVESIFINGDVDNETKLIITNMVQQVQSMGLKIDVAESNLNLIEVRISNIESQNLTGKMKLGLMFDLLADVCHIHVHQPSTRWLRWLKWVLWRGKNFYSSNFYVPERVPHIIKGPNMGWPVCAVNIRGV